MSNLHSTLRESSRGKLAFMLRCGVSAIALTTMAGGVALAQTANQTASQAQDQTTDGNQVEAVVVTGIRGSLQSSQQIKQNAEVFVDSITANDIGALPDRSVTEALQRVPGVSIDRFAAGRDPDHFSAEGSGVVIRGLTFVRSEFNGRDAFTANNGRGLSFQDVPAELMGGVDVFKNQSADMIEGGTAGTVNLRTRVPFDQSGQLISGSLEYSYGDWRKKGTPTGSVLYSNRWDTPVGEFGILGNYVDSRIATRTNQLAIANFGLRGVNAAGTVVLPTDPTAVRQVYVPRGANFRDTESNRKRQGYGAAAQWRSPDRTVVATLQFLRSEAQQAWTEHAIEIATDNVTSNGDTLPVTGTNWNFDENNVFSSGTITGTTGWRADQNQGVDVRTPIYGLQSNNQFRMQDQRTKVVDTGFNLKWTPNDSWGFNLDVQHVTSKVRNFDNGLWTSSYQNMNLVLHGDDLPDVTFLPPSLTGTVQQCPPPGTANCPTYFNAPHANFEDPYNSFIRAAMDHYEESEGSQDAVRFDVEYKFGDNDWVDSVRAGVRWADRDQTTRFSRYNWGVVTEQWGDNGPVWLSDNVDGVPNPNGAPGGGGAPVANQFAPYDFEDFMRGKAQVPTGDQSRLFYTGNTIANYYQYAALAQLVGSEWRAAGNWTPLAARAGVLSGTPFLPDEVNPVQENNQAAYIMLRYGHDLSNGMRLSGNIGVRYTKYDRSAQGYLSFPRPTTAYSTEAECATQIANYNAQVAAGTPNPQQPSPFCTLTPAQRAAAAAYQNGALVPNNQEIKFDYVLPSFNLKLDLGGGKIVRFGATKTMTPPDIGLVRNYLAPQLGFNAQDIQANGAPISRVTAGNPLLLPMTARNLDLSFEWYFAKVGQVSISLFDKRLKNVISNGTRRVTLSNNGQTYDAIVTTAENSPDTGKVQGFELAYQQTYNFLPGPFDGLGLNANFTYVKSDGVRQSTLSNTDPDVAAGTTANIDTNRLPLQGLSKKQFTIQPFYEKGPIQARLAYSWRSKYLLTTRDVIVPFAPIMDMGGGQLDASLFYNVSDHVKIGVQGVNLLNQVTRTTQVLNNDLLEAPRSWYMQDRRYTFILRGTF